MSYSTVLDILNYSQKVHEHARALYEQLREETQRERVDMLLRLLSHHEERLAQAVADYRDESRSRILKEWHQFEPADIGDVLKDCRQIHSDISVEDLVAIALKVDDFLIGTYQQLAADAGSAEARELFSNLAELEQAEKISAVRAALSTNDW
ncbi:hypothetical protein [Thalassolituus sp.]|uniref:hypothetical protein n=1 Tax=Thalassolituus sp. TaxID=2030822 RepID=UPI003518BB5A|nr:MAG: hypothetical protein CSH36_10335 [Thalassolituus sp.]